MSPQVHQMLQFKGAGPEKLSPPFSQSTWVENHDSGNIAYGNASTVLWLLPAFDAVPTSHLRLQLARLLNTVVPNNENLFVVDVTPTIP